MKFLLFWIGMILLIVDLATYYSAITIYFTTLGEVLLVVALALLIISGLVKNKKNG
jgi:hypothetical protein